ncbi:MAG: hypothetical protein P4L22_04665 [Candidatus Babeliales bacterium]|nr:hypothetical protein [Candidatus Babeliales bacterium]
MNKNKFSAFFAVFIILALFNIKTNCTDLNKAKKFIQNKPYYSALVAYTAFWSLGKKNNSNEYNVSHYGNKHFGKLLGWAVYLGVMGCSEEDSGLVGPALLIPGKNILQYMGY